LILEGAGSDCHAFVLPLENFATDVIANIEQRDENKPVSLHHHVNANDILFKYVADNLYDTTSVKNWGGRPAPKFMDNTAMYLVMVYLG